MTEKTKTPRIVEIKKFKTNFIVDNTIVATRTHLRYKTADWDRWQSLDIEESNHVITDMGSLKYYPYDTMTEQGQKLYDEWKAKEEAKKNEEDDED